MGRIGGPGDDAVGADEQGAQAQAVPGLARHVPHPVRPALGEPAKRRLGVEVQQQAAAFAEQGAEPLTVRQFDVGGLKPGDGYTQFKRTMRPIEFRLAGEWMSL